MSIRKIEITIRDTIGSGAHSSYATRGDATPDFRSPSSVKLSTVAAVGEYRDFLHTQPGKDPGATIRPAAGGEPRADCAERTSRSASRQSS